MKNTLRKMNKNINILRLLVLVLLTIVMGAESTWAQNTPSKWDESVSSSLSTQDGTNTNPGTSSNPYLIQSAADLAYFGSQMNGKNWYVVLTTDIDLDNHEWTYGKNSATNFKGHFDGNGKTISNLTIVPTSAKNNGFFSSLQGTSTARAEVKNLIIDGVTISQTTDLASTTITGALAGNVTEYTDIDNVTVKNVSVEFKNLTNTNFVGGLIGRVEKNNSKITTCSVEKPSIDITGEIKGGASYIGGAIGQFAGSANLLSTIDGLTVTSPSVTLNKISIKDCFIGAVLGRINTYSTVKSVTASSPALTYKNDGAPNVALNIGSFAGGIFGVAAQETAVTGTKVTGDATVTIGSSNNVQAVKAGLIGQSTTNVRLEDWTIEKTKVDIKGNLAGTASNIGGFIGYTINADKAPVTLKDIKITGNSSVSITGNVDIASQIGGFVGYALTTAGAPVTFKNTKITGNSTVSVGGSVTTASQLGGFAGLMATADAVNNTLQVDIAGVSGTATVSVGGNVTAASHYGGFAGEILGKSKDTNIVQFENITMGTTKVSIEGASSAASYYGGLAGYVTQGCKLNKWKVGSTDVKIKGDITTSPFIGSAIGSILAAANYPTSVTNVTIGDAALATGTTAAHTLVGAKVGMIGQASTNVLLDQWSITGNSSITVNGELKTTADYVGGFVGYAVSAANAPTIIKHISMPGTTTVNLTGNVTIATYVGGAIGDCLGVATDMLTVDTLTVKPSVTVNKVAVKDCCMGAVFGRINTFSEVDSITVSNPAFTYNNTDNQNFALNLGTFAGYIVGNATKEVPVTHVAIKGTAQLTIGTEAKKTTAEIKAIKAGLVGMATTNVRLQDWKTENTNVTVLGKLTTAASQMGGFAGNLTAGSNMPTIVKNIHITGKSSLSVSSNLQIASQIAGCVGYITGASNSLLYIKNIKIDGISTLEVVGDVTTACYLGGFAGQINSNAQIQANTIANPSVTIGGEIKTTNNPYIGGAIGYFTSAAGNTAYIDTLTVTNPKAVIGKVSVTSRIGSVFGFINNYTNINAVNVSNPTLNYSAVGNPNVALYLGTFAGYLTGVNAQETPVTNVTITGTANLAIGTEANKATTNISNVRAGLLGHTTTNVRLEDWTVANTNVQAYGSLTSTADYFGGLAGSMESGSSAPLTIKNVKVAGNSTVNVTGNIGVGSYLGDFAGAIGQGNVTYSQINIDDAGVDGVATVSVGGNVTAASYVGGFTGYLYGKAAAANQVKADNVTAGTINLTITGQTTAGSYYGGLAGRVNTMCELSGWNVKTASNLTFNGNITALSYVGGAIGSMEGAAGYPVSANGFDIKGIDVNFNCDITKGIYVGGLAGHLNAIDKTNKIEKSSVSGKVHTTGSHTYTNGNLPYTFGGIVGYLPQTSSTFSEVNNCVSEVDFDLSGLTPATDGNMYSGLVVGGVVGRINTPSRLPESLYYSGKIYAPTAGVGPIVGVFVTKLDDNKYIYDDYTGVNATAISADEWAKAKDWYYNGYQIGLSAAVTGQTLNTTESPVEGYLTIGKETLTNANPNSTATKISKTILYYAATSDIIPGWKTNMNSYPAYYMYYMQGVNRGNYLEDDKVEETKKDILSGKLAILILTDANADFTEEANRGVIPHTLTATASGVDSYKWYVDGNPQSETSENFAFTPAFKGNTIAVEAIKGDKAIKRVECKVISVLRVTDASAATLGTKTNPYLIGSADELQLLSYLSTLPLNTPWEKTYTSSNHYNKAYYELDGDIDLSGVEDFTPISFATGFVANNTMSLGYVFDGVFDGKLHTISGLKEGWYGGVINANDSYAGWGLFSIVGSPMPTVKVGDSETSPAVIRNLIIDGATLTHKTNNTTFNYNETTGVGASNNVCIGVLAGIVQNNTKIDNIEIRNSKVTDEGSSDYSLASRGLHVGGAVGTIQNAFNEIGNAPLNTKLQHIAAKVDITLEHPQFADATIPGQLGIFNVGGIIGRYCATSALQEQAQVSMPAYTLYSGSVNAPKAWISPVLGAIRYVAQQGLSFANYSKIWEGNNNADGTQLTILNAQYYNYKINGKLLTEFYPANTCARGARSIMLHYSDGLDDLATYDAKKYQGVNYTAISLDNGGNPTMKFMNEAQTDGMYWVCKDGFAHLTDQNPIDAYLAPQGVNKFNAELTGGSGSSYRWIVSFDGETWSDFEGVSGQSITAPASTIDKLIVAVITNNGVEYRSQPELVVSFDKCLPYMKQAGDESAGFDFSIVWFGAEPEASNVTYQWYHADKVTPFPDATYKSIHLTKSEFDEAGGTVWCQIKVLEYGFETSSYLLHSHPMDAIVVFVDGTNGVDNAENSRERGWTPETAVKTIDHANSLLDGGPWDKNIIVVVGTLNSDADFRSTGSNPATLTGKWDGTDYKGVIKIKQINPEGGGENDLNPVHQFGKKGSNCHVLADTKFEYLTFEADSKTAGNNFIECHGNDVWFGKGLVMTGFQNLTKNHGNLGVAQIIPELTIILTATNLNEETIRMYTNRVKPQEVTFESGHYGRIMGGRYTNGFFAKPENTSHTILGSAEHPVWAIVNVNIDKENPNKGIVYRNENPNKGTSEIDNFTCDINCIIAGLTDGTMYGDYQINVHGGKINYIVGGNQGNPVPNGSKTFTQPDGKSGDWGQWPNATYFGRTIINVEQDKNLKDIDIENLYAGGLGRERNGTDASTTVVDMYLYGRTEVNMKSGTVSGNVYGGGAGGVLGLNPWDAHVPYATTEDDNAANGIMNKVQYGMLDSTTSPTYAKVTLHNLKDDGTYEVESLDLEKSSTTLNITGGTINGSVYGGGYGFVSNMPTEVTMQGVGSIFGTTNVNISGGTILGSVYGGSQGASGYYGLKNNYGQTIDHIAEMNGTVNLKIYGTETQYPSIAGDIYGGGQGVATQNTEEYLRIATAGNIELGDKYKTDVNILIDLPESHPFEGNIYGGGEMGAVDGKTNVVIKSGYFDGNVYGGGKGEEGHANKAKVTGSTNVEIGTKTINVPITSEELDPEAEGEVTITGSVFGGGQKAIVTGNTRVKVGDQD